MGQLPSREYARLRVIRDEQAKADLLLRTLGPRAAAGALELIPYTPGSAQAEQRAVVQHLNRLQDEYEAICARLGECGTCSQRLIRQWTQPS